MDPTQWNAPFAVVAGALFVIVFLRANATYWVGRALIAGGRKTRLARFLDSPGYLRAAGWLHSWGAPAVAVSFLTIGIQTMVNLAAGVTGMPQRRYLPAVTLGCIMWALIYSTVGFVGFEAFSFLWERNPALALGLVAALVVSLTYFIVSRTRRRRLAGNVAPC